MGYGFTHSRSKKHGFTLAETLVAMFFVTMAVVLVGGLAQQVMQLAKRSTQTGSILEIRSMTNAITKNSDTWLDQMRSSVHTNGLYAGCIPDPKVNISTFSCPILEDSLLTSETELGAIANGQFHVVSAPIVSNSGEHIAGTTADPVYLSLEGRTCTESDVSKCTFKSTGYFMRSNGSTSQDPGSVKFVIKIERNPLNVVSASSPMKPQYMSIDIGDAWKDLSATFAGICPAGSIKVGYLSNGKPSCVSSSKTCGDSLLPIGIDSSGNPICKALPDCSASGGGIVLNPSGTDLMCSSSSPCGANKLFLGYFAGSGEPMCSNSEMKCSAGHVQTGIIISGGSMQAECEALPSCSDANTRLAFNGEKFVCEAAIASITCSTDEVMTGINADGSPNCVARSPASTAKSCPPNQYMVGILANGELDCRSVSAASSSSSGDSSLAIYESPELPLNGVNPNAANEFPNPIGMIPTKVMFSLIPQVDVAEYKAGEVVYLEHMHAHSGYISVTATTSKIFLKINHTVPYILTRNSDGYYYYLNEKNKWRLKYTLIYPKSGSSGGGARSSCPSGYKLMGTPGASNAYCIAQTPDSPATVANAINTCFSRGAELCTPQQWVQACFTNAVTGMISSNENGEMAISANGASSVVKLGQNNNCAHSDSASNPNSLYKFRCCMK